VLLLLQAAMALTMVHRESLTFDEDNHMFAGYMMWKTGDYGLNPEHPPLVKLLATVPVLHAKLWIPPLQGRNFKQEAYLDGRDWLARNDGGSQHMVFRMRVAAELLALGLCLFTFLAAREWFGDTAGLIALTLMVFDPNVMAHSARVTTDIGVTLFFVASIFAFYRYCVKPSPGRLLLAGLAVGLLLAAKHSGILIAPMVLLLAAWEIFTAAPPERKRVALRLAGAVASMTVMGVVILWAFYGFRYVARPAGLQLSTPLTQYAAPLSHVSRGAVLLLARLHLLPESYLMGLVDVKRMAEFYPTFLFGKVYSHGQWYYFPVVLLIKTTLGLLFLLGLAVFAVIARILPVRRELVYALVPMLVYLGVAMLSGMNIGMRHLMPMYAFGIVFAAAGAATLMKKGRTWRIVCPALLAAHIVSSLFVFPTQMAYANEAWGGPENLHNLLSDANVDWAQQLLQVKRWQDRHPSEECWFAYFARPEIDPATYGIHCHALPTVDTLWMGGAEPIPATIHGTVLISAGDLSGCEWPTGDVNPYQSFQARRPEESIDHAVFVYRGTFDMADPAAVARAQISEKALRKDPAGALAIAKEAVAMAPGNVFAQTALGDAEAEAGDRQAAKAAWSQALQIAKHFEPDAQPSYVPDIEKKIASQ
jgi:4-amino-4-deoxy-L-arabinose transferase-like glycosyltransferase